MGMDREAKFQRLNESDDHIISGEQRITLQRLVIEKQRASGKDVQDAERLLRTMEECLFAYHKHRHLILEMIEQIDAGLA